jgi:hypothetical protein
LGSEFDAPHLNDVIMFFYLVTVSMAAQSGSKNYVHTIGLTMLRAFGSLNLALAIMLGDMPSAGLKNMDNALYTAVAALLYVRFVAKRLLPAEVSNYLGHVYDLSYSIVKGSHAAAGYAMAAGALPGSVVAPFMGAYLGAQGHRLVEHGLKSMNSSSFDNDDLLGVLGGPLLYAMTVYGGQSAMVARAGLVAFHFSCNYVDYNNTFNSVFGTLNTVTSKRGSTPKRK